MPGIVARPALRRASRLCVFVFLLFKFSSLAAQVSGYVVIDGTKSSPAIVTSTVNVQIIDNGVGNYTLTFDQPVEFLLGTSMTQGPGFDVADSFISTTLDSSDKRKVNVSIRYVTGIHSPLDAVFSLEVRLAPST